MQATATAMFRQFHTPSAKTVAVCLLQSAGIAALLYAAAQFCLFLSGTAEGYGEDLQLVLRWAWIVPVPFYALAIGGKIAAEATGSKTLTNSPWLRWPARIAFSLPFLLMAYYYVHLIAINLPLENYEAVAAMGADLALCAACIAAVYYVYVKKLGCFRDKPVADALFSSLFPVLPLIALIAGLVVICIVVVVLAIPFMLKAIGMALRSM